MGAFAEEVDAEAQVEEIAEQKAVVVDMPEEEVEVAEQALVTGETQTCRFMILYVDSGYNLGYNYGDDWDVDYTCADKTGHNGYNHSINCSVIKEQVDKASDMVDSSWKIVGWTKTASANPQIFTTYTGTTGTQTTYTIYIVAKKNTPPAVDKTFTVNYMVDGALFKADIKTSTADSMNFNIITDVPTKEGYTFTGWVDASNTPYASAFTLSASTPNAAVTDKSVTLELHATWEEVTPPSPDEYAFEVKYVDDDGSTKAADDQTATNTSGTVTFKANSIYEDVAAKHEGKKFDHWAGSDGNNYKPGDDIVLTAKTGEDGGEITLSLISTTYLTLTAVYTDDGGTGGGDVPTPPTPGEKVSEPGMIKTVKDAEGTDKTGEGAIGTRKPGDVIDFKLQTNVGEDMMWTKDENDKKVQRLTKDENGTWGGADYVLTITDTMEGPMTADWTTLKVTLKGVDITDAAYVTKTTSATGFTITIDCVAALNAGAITEEDIGIAEILVTYTATVNADAADKAVLKNTATVNDSTESIVTGDVTNPPVTPPSTGGSGTRMFTIGGVLILAAACVLFAVSRKKAKD